MPAFSLLRISGALLLFACVALSLPAPLAAQEPLATLSRELPTRAEDFSDARADAVEQAAAQVETWFAQLIQFEGLTTPAQGLQRVDQLLTLKAQVDQMLAQTWSQRVQFAALEETPPRRQLLRNYLRVTSKLIDLSGRLRYGLSDALSGTYVRIEGDWSQLDQFVSLLVKHRSSIGALVASRALLAPVEEPPRRVGGLLRRQPQPPTTSGLAVQRKLLQLFAATGELGVMPVLVELINTPTTSPELILAAAATIRAIGLPQDPRPGQDPTLPVAPITAGQLATRIAAIDARHLSPSLAEQRSELLTWLNGLVESGLSEEKYQLGDFVVEPGDWLLMRNPSPYNRFTDLAPGLFTHVGVITTETGGDGRRRMVLVDLPERGDKIQSTNLDVYVQRTLHYVVLRHRDEAVRRKMADIARSIIDNPSQFDLNFRTARVAALRGQPLADKTIHTYCAGLLLLCAQETTAAREEFFPIPEYPAGGKTEANLAQLGLTFGDDFISPTGALFSPYLQLVGRRESMYDPSREAEEAVFDHFADTLIDGTLTPSPDLFQSLRQKLAEAGQTTPLLAQALAAAVGVNQQTDLVAAARTAAVVEALDEIALDASAGFRNARTALVAGPVEQLSANGFTPEDIAAVNAYRQRHADLHQQLLAGTLTPRQLRLALLDYYITKGKKQLDDRFFHQSEKSAP